jgi:dTDP-4-amino-4,6-dideoxygalactose transaminase
MSSIPMVDLAAQRRRLGPRIEQAINAVLSHGRFILGPEVTELESELARFTGVPHVVSCASGTDGLLMVLLADGVGPGDAVFVPAFTFTASAEVVALLGATPVFVDVDERTFNLDPRSLEQALTVARNAGLQARTVMAVDLFGRPADYGEIQAVAEAAGATVLVDAAQSFGARREGARVGSHARATATSFFPSKPLGCYGDGGAILTPDSDLADRLRSIRAHGRGSHKYESIRVGINGRLDTLQAAVLLQKMTVFEEELASRARIATAYAERLGGSVILPPEDSPDVLSAWAQFTIRHAERDRVAAALGAEGIASEIYYPRTMPEHPAYRECPTVPGGVAVSRRLAAKVLSLPMHPYLTDGELDRVAAVVKSAAG